MLLTFLPHTYVFVFSFSLRRRVVQVYERGARVLDGSYMTQDLSFGTSNSESGSGFESCTVTSVSIADPYVLVRMTDGSIRILIGGMLHACIRFWVQS